MDRVALTLPLATLTWPVLSLALLDNSRAAAAPPAPKRALARWLSRAQRRDVTPEPIPVRRRPRPGGGRWRQRSMGTVGFLVVSSAIILDWVLSNHVVHFLTDSWNGKGFDPARSSCSTSSSQPSPSTAARS